jgi:hypothetical protein
MVISLLLAWYQNRLEPCQLDAYLTISNPNQLLNKNKKEIIALKSVLATLHFLRNLQMAD